MKIVFQNDTMFTRILLVSNTWMCWVRGEGEEEIANHGWSRVKSFSQETGAKGQRTPRIGGQKPKLHSKNQVQDAHDSPTQLPFFLEPIWKPHLLFWSCQGLLPLSLRAARKKSIMLFLSSAYCKYAFLLPPHIWDFQMSFKSFKRCMGGFSRRASVAFKMIFLVKNLLLVAITHSKILFSGKSFEAKFLMKSFMKFCVSPLSLNAFVVPVGGTL